MTQYAEWCKCSRIFFSLIRTSSVFFDVHEEIWKKVQEFYYGDNPLNDALSKVNSEDMNLFFQALTKNPARLIEMQSKWWIGQMQIYQNIMLRSVNKDIQPARET